MFYVGLKWLTTDQFYSNNFAPASFYFLLIFIVLFIISVKCIGINVTQKSCLLFWPATNMLCCWIKKLNPACASGHGQDDSTKLNPSCSKTIWVMIQCDKLVEFCPWGLEGTSSWHEWCPLWVRAETQLFPNKKVNMHHDRFPAEPPHF